MQEMNITHHMKDGVSMKKVTVLVALVSLFVLASATVAFAVSPAYIPWNAGGANAGTGGPHNDYQLATEKCAVCHSVHGAAVSNAAAGVFGPSATGAAQTELLLRSSVADACNYCHIETNVAGLQVYNGVVSNYTVSDAYGHNGSPSAECADCHSVHGADTFGGGVGPKILKAGGNAVGNASEQVQQELVTYYAGAPVNVANVFTEGANRNAQVSAFCTRCHKTFSDASETTITASGYFSDYSGTVTFGPMSYKNHPMKPFEATFDADGANYTGQAAWVDATYCRSCHSAGLTQQSVASGGPGGVILSSFPHWTPNRASFLVSGWGSNDANATPVEPGNDVTDASQDGVCLRCHTDAGAAGLGSATGGVNVSF